MKEKLRNELLWGRARKTAMVCTGIWCITLGIGLTATLVGSSALASTNTAALLMIVGVITLPALTFLAIRRDSKVAGRVVELQPVETKVFVNREVVIHNRHSRVQRHAGHAVRSVHTEPCSRSKAA